MPLSSGGRQPQPGEAHREGTRQCQGQMALQAALFNELLLGKLLLLPLCFFEEGKLQSWQS